MDEQEYNITFEVENCKIKTIDEVTERQTKLTEFGKCY